MELTNPLTIEERLQIPRLWEHDSIGMAVELRESIWALKDGREEDYDLMTSQIQHVAWVTDCMANLIRLDKIDVSLLCSRVDLGGMLCTLEKLFEPNFSVSVNGGPRARYLERITGETSTLYALLFTIIKNAKESKGKGKGMWPKINVDLNINQSNFPEHALYIPEGARDYQHFIAFNVHDEGPRFPQDKPLREHIDRRHPTGPRGFGLYFTGLAAKVLRAPVHIDSVPGNTNVIFYHPIYETNEPIRASEE